LPDSTLGSELLPENISYYYLEEKGKEVILRMDVSKYKIEIPPIGLYVGLEYVGEVNSKTDKDIAKACGEFGLWRIFTNTPEIYKGKSYSRYKKGSFKKDEPLLTLIGLETKQ